MSNPFRGVALQLRKSWASAFPWLERDCLRCAGPARGAVICRECEAALPLLASPQCARCAIPIPSPGICGACLANAPTFDDADAVYAYRFPLDRLVGRFKYAGDLAAGRWLATRLAARVRMHARPDLLVAPPITSARMRGRGFNQSVEIARIVGRALGVPCATGALTKVRETEPQPGLRRRERRANLRQAFRCRLAFSGEHVAVVDDVITTGTTADAIAKVLKAAGAGRVSAWAVARTPDPAMRCRHVRRRPLPARDPA